MRSNFSYIAVVSALFIATSAAGQYSGRDALQVYRQQAGPSNSVVAPARGDRRRFARYDHDKVEPGQAAYYADRYYRAGYHYEPRVVAVDERIYRGSDERYYCRRADGTTGRITGGSFEYNLQPGESRQLGLLIAHGDTKVFMQPPMSTGVTCR